ncbi:MAG: hypothetical protein ABIL09_03870 [Gemmatimonadota bacterium]
MVAGRRLPAERIDRTDPPSGRRLRQWTSAPAHSYPLYYFVPSHTADGRYLVLHSERDGWVQLYRLDLASGELVQLTDGRTGRSGWAIWCERHLRGVYNHLSALEPGRGEVFYFQDEELRGVEVDSLRTRVVLELPGRVPLGQAAFSPDGRHFAFVHADCREFEARMDEREALTHMGQFHWGRDHNAWRERVPTTIGVVDGQSGAWRLSLELSYHVHHVLFLDDEHLLINHVRGDSGMWTVRLDGSDQQVLRPRDRHGVPCHQVLTRRGICYEANDHTTGRRLVYMGRADGRTGCFREVHVPDMGYVHTGRDPEGWFCFGEDMTDRDHRLFSLHHPGDPERQEVRTLRAIPAIPFGQRFHAHPFLSPDRRWLFYTELVEGFSQVCALEVGDLVDRDEYWDAAG